MGSTAIMFLRRCALQFVIFLHPTQAFVVTECTPHTTHREAAALHQGETSRHRQLLNYLFAHPYANSRLAGPVRVVQRRAKAEPCQAGLTSR
jgi:hypothetical protein